VDRELSKNDTSQKLKIIMKRKDKIPRLEAFNWRLEIEEIVVYPATQKKPDEHELMRLEMIKRAGGLLKEKWVWARGSLPVFDSYILPKHTCTD
jgi:hypothetical protein